MAGQNIKNKDLFIKVKAPTQCHLWTKKELTHEDLSFINVRTYYKSSHLDRCVLKCKDCGQLYYYEFYEIVDWLGGDDKIYCSYVPIDADENFIKDLNTKEPLELLGVTPQIHWDPDDRIYWVR